MPVVPLKEQLLRRKPIVFQQQHHQGHELARTLSTFQLMMFGVGATVGTGIFFVLSEGPVADAGPAVIISVRVAAIADSSRGRRLRRPSHDAATTNTNDIPGRTHGIGDGCAAGGLAANSTAPMMVAANAAIPTGIDASQPRVRLRMITSATPTTAPTMAGHGEGAGCHTERTETVTA